MFDQRAYLLKLETSTTAQLAEMILSNNPPEEHLLQVYFGPDRYARMRSHAASYQLLSQSEPGHGAVIIIPGILGSELWEGKEKIWLDIWNIFRGDFDQFSINADGSSIKNIQTPSMLKKYYGEMQLALAKDGWSPVLFPFDWRLDIAASAGLLKDQISAVVDPDEPLRFVAHSMGGLVVRSLLKQDAALSHRLERFIMMGTPNFGSFAIPILYSGLNSVLKLVSIVDRQHNMDDLLAIAKTFVGTYEMQPFLGATPDAERLFDPATYGTLKPPQNRFDGAKLFQARVTQGLPLDPHRCNYIAGFNEATPTGILDWHRLTSMDGYKMTQAGDGTVPHLLGLLPNLTTYFVHAKHSDLPSNQQVISAVNDLLATGKTTQLPTNIVEARSLTNQAMQLARQEEQTRLEIRVARLRDEVIARRSTLPNEVSSAELELRNILVTGREVTD